MVPRKSDVPVTVSSAASWTDTEPVPIGNRLQNVTPSDVGGATSAWNAHLWDVAS